ncbi:MAG: MarR family transcriptional regulator [Myxococcota bacterium]
MMQSSPDALWRHLTTLRHLLVDEMQAGLSATAALDLSVPQSIALFRIADAGPLTISALQTHLGRSQSATSHLVSQLEHRGLVERGIDPEDRRRTAVALSAGGKELLARIQTLRRESFESVYARLPPEVARQLEAALDATVVALKGEKS